jgi:hypothetical protein
VEKYGISRLATGGNIIRYMRIACRITKTKMQTHTPNIQYLLHFDGKNGYGNAPQCYVVRGFACLLFYSLLQTYMRILSKMEPVFFYMHVTRKTSCRKTALSRRMYSESLIHNYLSLTGSCLDRKQTKTDFNRI